MKKILKIGLIGCVASILMSGCANNYLNSNNSYDVKSDEYIYIKKDFSASNIQHIIMDIGTKNGWRMTEFKSNEIIAENKSDANLEAISIHFTNKYFFTRPKNDDLEEIIENALQN